MYRQIYKSLFENSFSIMIIIHPETGDIVDANKAACKFYGYKKHELTSMKIQDINMLSDEEVAMEMQDAKAEKRNYFNFQHRLANGNIRDVEVFSGPINIYQEDLLYSIINDITLRKQIEVKIQKERQFSESLINALPGVMYVFDQLGNFKRWNKNFEKVSGYTPGQIRQMNPLDFITSEDKNRVREKVDKVFEEGQAHVEAGFCTITGRIIPTFLTGYRFPQNGVNYLVGVGLDISDRVRAEQEKDNLITQLQASLAEVKQLSGFLPICASCKKIRDDKGYWNQIESYLKAHSEAEFSHSICPDCTKKLYPDFSEED